MRVTSDVGPWSITPEWVLDAEISDRAVRLYGLLGRYADDSGSSFASRKKLAERLRCSVASLDRAVIELSSIQALEVDERKRENGSQTSNLYVLRMSSPVRRGVITSEEGGVIMGEDPKNENQEEREELLAATPRKRNEIWDALSEIFGEPATRTAQTGRGKVCSSLTAAGATPDEIFKRAKRWALHFDHATLTDHALEKHWHTLPLKPRRIPR